MTAQAQQPDPAQLFDADGHLNRTRFDADALALLETCTAWLQRIGRSAYLPIDLLVVGVEENDPEIVASIARATGLPPAPEALLTTLRELASRIERPQPAPPTLDTEHLSLGFTSILSDAAEWAAESGRTTISRRDIVRVLRWRTDMQESASLRWALQQLAQPSEGATLFAAGGDLDAHAAGPWLVRLLQRAMRLGCQAGMPFLGTPHVVAALLEDPAALLVSTARTRDVDPRRLRDELLGIVGNRHPALPPFRLGLRTLTPRLVRLLLHADRLARANGRRTQEPEFLAALNTDGGSSWEVVARLGLSDDVRRLANTMRAAGAADEADFGSRPPMEAVAASPDGTPTLDSIGRDLTALARDGRLGAVLGRDRELQRVINVLLRTEQRNPLLTGEAGVGKTAIAAALAQRIVEGRVPARLRDMRVIELSGAALLGGTSYRGELEARIKSLLREASQDVILFIDEAHAVFAPRTNAGQPAEIPNHFKAALASDEIAVVAATTEAEYHRWIEQDPALRRRFERIEVPEMSGAHTRTILAQLAPQYEKNWEVPITPEAVDAAVEMSVRYMPEQSLPDKAKKLLMDATIAVSSEVALDPDAQHAPQRGEGTPSKRVVTRLDIARQVSDKTSIPLDRIHRSDGGWWTGLEARLLERVVGQDDAVRDAARTLVTSRLQSAGRRQPLAVLVLVGPPGTGKVELAEALAIEVFGTERAMLRLDMNDYTEPHAVSRLIGSPPGYVGYEDEDALVSPLRRRPSRVVLLQDFDRAHPRIQDRLMRLLHDGVISDTRGMTADASHAVFVLTVETSIGSRAPIGFGSATAPDQNATPELMERLRTCRAHIVRFRSLAEDDHHLAKQLLEDRLQRFQRWLLEEYAIEEPIREDVLHELERRLPTCRDARDLDRLFQELVVEPFGQQMLTQETVPTPASGNPAAPTRSPAPRAP